MSIYLSYPIWRLGFYRQSFSPPGRSHVPLYLYELFIGAILADQINPDQASVVVVEEKPELEAVAIRMNLALYQRTPKDGPLPTLHV